MRRMLAIICVLVLAWSLAAVLVDADTTTGNGSSVDDKKIWVSHDEHFSTDPLPKELSDASDCSCERWLPSHTHSCKGELVERASSLEGGPFARIFYLVVVHNERTLNDAVHLFRSIRDPRNTILFHIDTKFDYNQFLNSILHQEIQACPCGSHVEVASIHDSKWSSWSMNLPTLWGIEKAVEEYNGKWDVFINLSGDTLPVYTPDRISQLFGGPLAGINFVTASACETGLQPTPITYFPEMWHKYRHYVQNPMSLTYVDNEGVKHTEVTLETYFGSQWMALQPDWCQFLTEQLKRPDSLASQYRDYLIETEKLMTDETFIPTLLMHYFPDTLPKVNETDDSLANVEPKIFSTRYERMDEHYPTSTGWFPTNQHYDVGESTGVESPRPWGPYFLGVYDLHEIKASGALYIRKVSERIDSNMPRLLPVDVPEQIPDISWPEEVAVIQKPDWGKKLKEMKKKYATEQAKQQRHQHEDFDNSQDQHKSSSSSEDQDDTEF